MVASVGVQADFAFVPRYNIAPTQAASIVALSPYGFTSKRREEDQVPPTPDESFARTRHHIFKVGKVLVLN